MFISNIVLFISLLNIISIHILIHFKPQKTIIGLRVSFKGRKSKKASTPNIVKRLLIEKCKFLINRGKN